MADSEYPSDIQFAGLVQAATAAADEQTRTSSRPGKRKRADEDDGNVIDPSITTADEPSTPLQDSAAVLFREPSVKSKKYSRPPLGKVYSSLELAPEVFLRLQNAVKSYMLDPEHPDRSDVVGHKRHSGGAEVAKLKLWNCVEEFLKHDDNGAKFFGRDTENPNERTMFWPEDSAKIIKACMPLMRKMVTNERQRLYALEVRKAKQNWADPGEGQVSQGETLDESSMLESGGQQNGTQTRTTPTPAHEARIPTPIGSVVLLINLMTSEGGMLRRIIPRFSLSPEAATNLASLRQRVKEHAMGATDRNIDHGTIRVLMSDGLIEIKDDGEWMVALLSAGTVEWMDGEVRVLVEI